MDELQKAAAAISLHDEEDCNNYWQEQESLTSLEKLKKNKNVSKSVFITRDRTAPATDVPATAPADVATDVPATAPADVATDVPAAAPADVVKDGVVTKPGKKAKRKAKPFKRLIIESDSDNEPSAAKADAGPEVIDNGLTDSQVSSLTTDTFDSRFGGYRSSNYPSASEGSPYESTDDDDENEDENDDDEEPDGNEPNERVARNRTPAWVLEMVNAFFPYYLDHRQEYTLTGTDRLHRKMGTKMLTDFVESNKEVARSIVRQACEEGRFKHYRDSSLETRNLIVKRANMRYGVLQKKKAAEAEKKAAEAEKRA